MNRHPFGLLAGVALLCTSGLSRAQHSHHDPAVHGARNAAPPSMHGAAYLPTGGSAPNRLSGGLASPKAGEWPMFKRDLAHTGLVPSSQGVGAISSPCLKWSI